MFLSALSQKYEPIKIIAETIYSQVYSAKSLQTDSPVVIKIPQFSKHSAFQREGEVMRKLSCVEGVPQILSSDKNYLVIELLGSSLEDIIEQEVVLDLKRVISIGVKMLGILKQIHEKGFIHRDIKPANILLSREKNEFNKIYLIDYGLAKEFLQSSGKQKACNNKKKCFKGTFLFAARNAHFGISGSRKDDLESLGYTLLYLLKGHLPWSELIYSDLNLGAIGKMKTDFIENPKLFGSYSEFRDFFSYCEGMKFETIPDYEHLSQILLKMSNDIDKWSFACEKPGVTRGIFNHAIARPCFQINDFETVESKENVENEQDDSNAFENMQRNLMFIAQSPVKIGKKEKENRKFNEFNELFKKAFGKCNVI